MNMGNDSNRQFSRYPIPELRSRNMRIGLEGQLKRSWSVAPNDFFRIYMDEPLKLDLEFSQEMLSPKVMLYTNLLGKEGEWKEIEFTRSQSRHFSLSILPECCGSFLFKLKYSMDNGATWFWDRTPFTQVIIDPAEARSIRLYTLIPTVSGPISHWKKDLGRIRDMGFSMIHLLPITNMDSSESPYAAANLFQIDPSFLDPEDKREGLDQFEDFIQEAKEKGLGLCLDLVMNHIGQTSDMALNTPEWIVPDKNESNGLLRAGCWHMNNWIKWNDLVRINYDVPELQMKLDLWKYMQDYALFWSTYAAYTNGMIRLDNLHSSHSGFITSMLTAVRKKFPSLIIQAEYFSDSNTLLKAASEFELTLLLANPWEYPFAEQLREYIRYLHGICTKLRFLTPVTTHDTGSPAQLYGLPEAVVPRYFITALMSTGQTGFVQGAEHGVTKKIEFIGKSRSIETDIPNRFSASIKKINEIHASSSIFHRGGNLTFIDNNHGALLVAVREEETTGERFLLCANLDTSGIHSIILPCDVWKIHRKTLTFHELINEEIIHIEKANFEVNMGPSEVKAYKMEYS